MASDAPHPHRHQMAYTKKTGKKRRKKTQRAYTKRKTCFFVWHDAPEWQMTEISFKTARPGPAWIELFIFQNQWREKNKFFLRSGKPSPSRVHNHGTSRRASFSARPCDRNGGAVAFFWRCCKLNYCNLVGLRDCSCERARRRPLASNISVKKKKN